ncbi:hypothetical protein Tco_1173437, partial [Tanacetum coccineum]
MNKPEVETMSIDDLYNNFKIVEQKVKKSVGTSSGAQNLAFMTAPSTSSTNDANTASPQVSATSPNVNAASPQVSTASVSDNIVYAFMVESPNGSNVLHQDLEQIHEDDLEVMDLKWQLSLLSVRAKKECRAPRSKEGQFRNQDNTKKQGNNEDKSSKAMLAIDGVGFDWSDMAEEQVQTNMALIAFSDTEDEFKEPEFKGYGPENREEQVSQDKSSFVESSLNVDKEIVFPVNKKVEFTKPENHEKPVKKSVRYAEMYRSQSPRGNQRNWNGQKSKQLGNDFVMHNKACYVCGSFNHLQYTCKQKRQLNGQREEKPVWNNARRVNHQNSPRITQPNLKRHMVPRKILTRQVNTARPKAVVNAVRTNRVNAIKASACWGNPKTELEDSVRFGINKWYQSFALRNFDLEETIKKNPLLTRKRWLIWLFQTLRPNKLDLSYSWLDEFKEPEFKGYGPKHSEQESNM